MTKDSTVQAGATRHDAAAGEAITIRAVPFDRPWEWLGSGWRDLWRHPGISLAYGVLVAAMGLLLTFGLGLTGFEAMIPVLAGGFLLIGPLLAVGLYEKSRRLEVDEPVTLKATIDAAKGSALKMSVLLALLGFLYLVWMRIAFMLLALFLGTQGLPPAREFMPTLLFTSNGLGLLVVGTAVGALLAGVAFSAAAISIPMLMHRRVDAFTAMAKSAEAVIVNPKPMALWAALIAGFVALGIATIGAGLVLAFPLIGHATWHAYRDITGRG